MEVHVLPGLPRWGVIIAGGKDAAADALAYWVGSRPMHNPFVNGYGGVHTDVWAEEEQLRRWFAATHDRGPGALLFYMSV